MKDTVGSGDSFLAGFLSKRLETGESVDQSMQQAICLGAFITGHEGACLACFLEEFVSFKKNRQVSPLLVDDENQPF